MKKLIAVMVAAVVCISSTFALGFGFGARGFLGTELTSKSFSEVGDELKAFNFDKTFDYGFGVYADLSLLGGLGIQGEVNLTYGTVKLSDTSTTSYEAWNIDVPLMLWLNQDIGKVAVGLGAGPNFAISIPTSGYKEAMSAAAQEFKDKQFNIGVAVGLDLKFYPTDHFGIVLGGRYITDFTTTNANNTVQKDVEFTRKSLYANAGVEIKLF